MRPGGGANFNDIPDLGQLRQFGQGKWFNIGYVLCGRILTLVFGGFALYADVGSAGE